MRIRPAEPRDADAVLALMEGLTRPAVAEDPAPQREVFRRLGCHRLVLESGHHRAEAHQLYESYGFAHYGRAYGLDL